MSIARHHAEWLSLVPVSGPFLSLPVLLEAFPQGLDAHEAEHARLLRLAYEEWDDSFQKSKVDPGIHDAWIKFVLTKTLEYDDGLLAEGQAISQTFQVEVPEHGELLRPSIVLNDPATQKPRMLIQTYPRSQDLSSYVAGSRWKASPDTRMTDLLHATGVQLGLVTNGEHWMLAYAPKGETTGYASWYASLWREEKITLQAFRSLLSMPRLFGVADDETLESLLKKSASNQQEVTDQLGLQVRRAVEVLVQSLDRADQDHERELLVGVSEAILYESALTVMMRLVFLFCAEERELIPTKPFPVYEQNYSVSAISKQLREIADQHGEELLERRFDAWPRLLSAFRAVYGGVSHDDVYMPAYGGRLFDPDRFPFLEGRQPKTRWQETDAIPLPVNNRTVLHLLEALQFLQVRVPGGGRAEARRLSFRALDIEQIGHVYEGLLDHTAKRAAEPFLGLTGSKGKEPEVTLAELEKQQEKGQEALLKFLKDETGRTPASLQKALNAELDAQEIARFRTACQAEELWRRVERFAGLVRQDTFGYPVVIPKGSVFVTEGTDRRTSGTHYTPRSLAEPIVQYTLEPLVYVGPAEGKPKSEWKLKSAKELLDLKVCDMACGSGAFLVQAARYLAERLMEAWDANDGRAEKVELASTVIERDTKEERFTDTQLLAETAEPYQPAVQQSPHTTPHGQLSLGNPEEQLIPTDAAERRVFAMRLITQRCLYGVDVNPLAAEMAKLSLWLLTLAKDKPFEFLDHAIRCGDSLVGLHNIEQLRHFSLKPEVDDAVLFTGPLNNAVDEAIALRLKIEDMPSNTVEDVEAQEKILKEADEKITRLRCAADLLVAAEFWGENGRDKREKVRHAAVVCGHYIDKGPTEEFEEKARQERRGQRMFHWPLEFPEVIVKQKGFDAFVGNPPFMGGLKIGPNFGNAYRPFLVAHIAHGANGTADLCVYFILRAFVLQRLRALLGFVATNTLSQGDTREVGLEQLVENGASIPRAVASTKWPGQANLEIAQIWIHRGAWNGVFNLNGVSAARISAFLTPTEAVTGRPHRLASNAKLSFQGSNILGVGFTLSPDQAIQLIEKDQRNADVLFPYLNGDDLTSRPDQSASRWVINFRNWPLSRNSAPTNYIGPVASDYPELLAIVEREVRPQRATNSDKRRRDLWWQFTRPTLDLYSSISSMERVLVAAQTSKFLSLTFASTNHVFSHMTVVFAFESDSSYAVLNTSWHTEWIATYCSTLETRLRYLPTDGLETFPLPQTNSATDDSGRRAFHWRHDIMLDRNEGLTKTYNRFHSSDETSSDIQKLRDLQVEMDQTVAAAYGWTDLGLGHGFHETKQGVRFTINEPARREVLQRLLKLNHERYAEEVKKGEHGKTKSKKNLATVTSKKTATQKGIASPILLDFGTDVSFPSTEHEIFLCGLACDLVAADPGMPSNAYRDALVVAIGWQRHKRLLTGKDRMSLAKLCKVIPTASSAATQRVPWGDITSVLILRNAIFVDSHSDVQRGVELEQVRRTYPAIAPELVNLIRKAASELRELQSLAEPNTLDEAAILKDFQEDQRQMCRAVT